MNSDSSRFAHFNKMNHGSNGSENSMDTQDNSSSSSNDAMVISAGLTFQSPANTGSFVTAIVNGHDNPCGEKATIIRPPSAANGGREEIITYDNLSEGRRENGSIGSVSFTKEQEVTNSWIPAWIPGWNQGKSHQSNPVTFPILNPVKSFEIKVHVHSDGRYQQFSFTVSSTDMVDKLKELIKGKTGLTFEEQKMVFAGKNLTCGKTLGDCQLKEGAEVLLEGRMPRLRGG